jgi:hypothetical protein
MDDLDDLLMAKQLPAEPTGLREAVASDAARVQRRRRWVVRGRRVAILAACYAAGLASMWYWSRERESVHLVVESGPQPEPSAPAPAESPGLDPYRNDPPERLEKWAFVQSGEKRVELYRRAGDGYLRRDDVDAALRCYRKALDLGSAADLAIRADTDTWLLMSLKVSRQREKADARIN